jgi:quercetin dioxygenase-like cupin family protein
MKISHHRSPLVSLAAIALAAAIGNAAAQGTSDNQSFVNPKDIKWADAPPSLPKGGKVAVLRGDPGQSGPFVIRLEAPAGYRIPPHWHSQDESLTVISGTFYLGAGDKVEPGKAHALGAGGFHFLPAKAHHYAFTKTRAVVQVNGNGPFDVTYINPDDDPQKAKH